LENEDSKNGTAFGNNGKNSDFGVAQRFERFDKAFFSARALAAGPLKRVFQQTV